MFIQTRFDKQKMTKTEKQSRSKLHLISCCNLQITTILQISSKQFHHILNSDLKKKFKKRYMKLQPCSRLVLNSDKIVKSIIKFIEQAMDSLSQLIIPKRLT